MILDIVLKSVLRKNAGYHGGSFTACLHLVNEEGAWPSLTSGIWSDIDRS
jgi:hypothetical protein